MPELRNYQIEGINQCLAFLQKNKSCYLADEMGLGKTAQAISISQKITNEKDCILVVCPASLRLNWRREFNIWAPKQFPSSNVIFSSKDIVEQGFFNSVTIISYDLVFKKFHELRKIKWKAVIFDEAHFLKNRKAKRTQVCLQQLIKFCQYKIYLSGTPIPNSIVDAWTVFHAINPQSFGPFWTFARRYTNVVQNPWGGYECKGSKNMSELRKKVRSSFFVRRTKQDVLTELPDKIYSFIPLQCKMTKEEREFLQNEGIRESVVEAIAAGKGLPQSEHVATTRRILGNVKLTSAVNYIKDLMETEKQIVVFAHHREVIKKLRQRLERCAFRVAEVSGSTPARARDSLVEGFQNGDYDIFVGQIQAAGVGITLTAAKVCVFVETDWVPANVSQAIDRLHRIGQKDVVNVQYLVAEKSIDGHIMRTLNKKVEEIREVID